MATKKHRQYNLEIIYCPNCQQELKPFRVQGYDDVQYYCRDVQCGYATTFSFALERATNDFRHNQKCDPQWVKEIGFDLYDSSKESEELDKFNKEVDHINNGSVSKVNLTDNIVNADAKQIMNEDLSNKSIKERKYYDLELDAIIGYSDIKKMLKRIVNSKGKKRSHALIVGAAGTSKTVFLKTLQDELVPQGCNFHYVDASTLTKRGLTDYIFDNDNISILAIDEIDKLSSDQQAVFLNILEIGVLQTTSFNNTRTKSVKDMLVIATGNYLDKIIEPLRTRFLTMYLKAYDEEEYIDVSQKMLMKKYNYISKEVASYIAVESYKRIKPPSLRNVDRLGNLIKDDPTIEAVNEILEVLVSYAIPKNVLAKLDKQT